MILFKNWWGIAFLEKNAQVNNILIFILYGHLLILLYLLVSAVFPDKIPPEGIDLKTYYFDNHRYFWGLMAASSLMALLVSVVRICQLHAPLNLINLVVNLVPVSLVILLAVSKRMWIHAVTIWLFIAFLVVELIG